MFIVDCSFLFKGITNSKLVKLSPTHSFYYNVIQGPQSLETWLPPNDIWHFVHPQVVSPGRVRALSGDAITS